MTNREKLISRIQKLLSLASRNPSAEEAETALLQARKLMAENDVSETDVEGKADKVDWEEAMSSGRLSEIKANLMVVIASAHRCSVIRRRSRHNGTTTLLVVGYDRDRAVVKALYDWALRCMEKESGNYVTETRSRFEKAGMHFIRYDAVNYRRSFSLGFATGLQTAYQKQTEANPQWAMVLATPVEVSEFVEHQTNGRSRTPKREVVEHGAFDKGRQAGVEHVHNTSHRDAPRLEGLPRQLGT